MKSDRTVDRDARNTFKRPDTADQGESVNPRRPSNASTVQTGSDRAPGYAYARPVSHSRHSAERSSHYHKNVVEASQVRPSATKMTRAEHPKTNEGDRSLGWPATHNTTLGAK